MTTYWDMQTVYVINKSGCLMTLITGNTNKGYGPSLNHGAWSQSPVAQIPVNNGEPELQVLQTRSINAAEVGPGPGSAWYLLQGTEVWLHISFDMIFAVLQPTHLTATATNSRTLQPANYAISIACAEDTWHGQGRRYYGTITITSAANSNQSTATCTKTN